MTTFSNDQEMRARITAKELARDLGMSISTVSRAFDPKSVVASTTRRRVLERAAEIGYSPNPLARSLVTRRTRIIGLVVSDVVNPFYPEMMARFTSSLRDAGMNAMLQASNPDEMIDDAVRMLLDYQPDAVVVMAATLSSAAAMDCRRAGIPVVFFNRLSSDPQSFGITCDNVEGGRRVAQFLFDRGHRKLAYVSALRDASTNIERYRGFQERCAELGLDEPIVVEAGSFSYEAGYHAAAKLAAPGACDGYFCANDILAIGFIEGIRQETSLRIPLDLSVVGFDDIAMAAWPSHALTTIPQPVDEMLAETLTVLESLGSTRISHEPFIRRIAPGDVIERKTTRRRHG
ncbi:LacI family DNA-binding transcriptional regulator [Aurantimonas sp. VKM B-3413]|uniref:LacI family DNA-binding transcriptional regulator n=1 Tax=Aurantimonas sp. VKM B-3413 TaxID=2779401 RepID=UPI001E505B9C|nr:LacI family DNA-binding transcriptional regulator [Aurantimonas sp. VKM B-3413]MCB8840500.1 LacI family DNA-binding transcriptional regulator [Aurantimonas sp. VKM B-3413]